MDDRATTHDAAGSAAVLATAIELQRGILNRHLDSEKKRLKPKATHELRVALRRMLSALALSGALGLSLQERSWRRLRKLLSRLSPARDAHVQLRQLGELLPTHPGTAALLAELRRRRRTAARRASKALQAFARSDVDRELSVVLGSLHACTASAAAVSAAMLGQLAQRHLGVERQLRSADTNDPEVLHAVRLALKDYRYALEALASGLPPNAQAAAACCEELQSLLGDAHDTHVLAATARQLARAQGSDDLTALAGVLDQHSRDAHAQAGAALSRARLIWLTDAQ